jgi:hypothetical protein
VIDSKKEAILEKLDKEKKAKVAAQEELTNGPKKRSVLDRFKSNLI